MKFLKGLDKDTEKNDIHVKKVAQSQNFLSAFIDELWKTRKIRILKKWKKILLRISSFYTCVPKATIIWGTVPEIQSEPFHLPPPPPHPPPFHCNNSENQNFEIMKKESGDVIILNLCNKKHDKIMYAYSDMECKTSF